MGINICMYEYDGVKDGQVRRGRVLRYERRRQEAEGKRTRTASSALYYLFLPNGNDLKAACVCSVCVVCRVSSWLMVTCFVSE